MNVLVVDDETDVKDLFRQKFRKEIKKQDYDFSFAHSADEALGYLNEHEHEAFLVLSDINMPGKSGLELLEEIKTKHHEHLKVMMISAYGDQENLDKAKTLGADDFFTKPVDFNQLKEKLKQIA